MQAAARRSLTVASRRPALVINRRRYPRQARTFHTPSARALSIWPLPFPPNPHDPRNPGNSTEDSKDDSSPKSLTDILPSQEISQGADGENTGTSGGKDQKGLNEDGSKQTGSTSGRQRRPRQRQPKEVPPVRIPQWFLSENVKLALEGNKTRGILEIIPDEDGETIEAQSSTKVEEASGVAQAEPATEISTEEPIYHLRESLMDEIRASLSASFAMPSVDNPSFPLAKLHLKLHCPVDGGIYFLDKVVEQAAADTGANVVRLDAQDLAELSSDYVSEGPEATMNALWSFGYDSRDIYKTPDAVDEAEQEEDDGEDTMQNQLGKYDRMNDALSNSMRGLIATIDIPDRRSSTQDSSSRDIVPFFASSRMGNGTEWNELKLGALLDTLLGTPETKTFIRSSQQAISDETNLTMESAITEAGQSQDSSKALQEAANELDQPVASLPPTIILLRDVREMRSARQSKRIIGRLFDLVRKRRTEGQRITLVGTSSGADFAATISPASIENLQTEGVNEVARTLVVTPDRAGPSGGLFYDEARRRTFDINARHLCSMLSIVDPIDGLASNQRHIAFREDLLQALSSTDKGKEFRDALEEQFISFDEVHRIVLTALGLRRGDQGAENANLSAADIVRSLHTIERSDEAKRQWAHDEQQLQQPTSDVDRKTAQDARIKRLQKTCNNHEKALLRGVVNPEKLRTTFTDVHVPQETIEALRNLTQLSLTRPDAFKYGVLATEKITGALLYGPPGTGKTLLAKAVAKESGATMLEVSGSDLYDMYVGEGEKNVRAVFTLAKKLAPCVVFIDEADAIFASRGPGTNRNTHRELINQFLREWDGMEETSAFIMVATNRPFDIDDAALRRLPRRLLIDLPTEKDREAILGIHLKEETLDSSISLSKLAAQTPYYSGSDLKNVAVAAALAAVREENDSAKAHTGEEAFRFPERRTLTPPHFDKALEEISASISEDMSTLNAIKKFDEKYGDRRGRKKRHSLGFSGGESSKEDTLKVRS